MRLTKKFIADNQLTVFRGYIDGFVDKVYRLYKILEEHDTYYVVNRRW